MVSISSATPRHRESTRTRGGMITPSRPRRAVRLIVSRPREGWQSIMDDVVLRQQRLQHPAEHVLNGRTSLDQAGPRRRDRSMLLGSRSMPSMAGLYAAPSWRGDVPLHQQVVDGALDVVRLDAEADGRRRGPCGVEVHEQDLAALLGQGGPRG